jgi:hypothetical protein
MTVITMSRNELARLRVLIDVADGRLSVEDATGLIGVGRRQIYRLLQAFHADGPDGLISRKRGGPSNGHAQDCRNADPAGHQHDACRRRIEREMVSRLAGTDESARLDGIDQGGATAARGELAQDPDQIAMLLARIVAERILAHQARCNLDVYMRTRTEPRQRFACGIDEFEARDVIGYRISKSRSL